MNICLSLPRLELCFKLYVVEVDLLVNLVYLSTGWEHDGRNKDTCILCVQIEFPFLWPVYTHHSYIIQVKDTCIHKVRGNGGSQRSRYVLIKFHSSCLCSMYS